MVLLLFWLLSPSLIEEATVTSWREREEESGLRCCDGKRWVLVVGCCMIWDGD